MIPPPQRDNVATVNGPDPVATSTSSAASSTARDAAATLSTPKPISPPHHLLAAARAPAEILACQRLTCLAQFDDRDHPEEIRTR